MKLALFLAAVLAVFSVYASEMLGKVVKVADGDTITLLVSTNEQHNDNSLRKFDDHERKWLNRWDLLK